MRLDKFLKVSRLVKQRTRAKQLCDNGAVHLNGHAAKAGATVKAGDIIRVTTRDRAVTAKILEIPSGNVSKKRARELFETLKTEWYDEEW